MASGARETEGKVRTQEGVGGRQAHPPCAAPNESAHKLRPAKYVVSKRRGVCMSRLGFPGEAFPPPLPSSDGRAREVAPRSKPTGRVGCCRLTARGGGNGSAAHRSVTNVRLGGRQQRAARWTAPLNPPPENNKQTAALAGLPRRCYLKCGNTQAQRLATMIKEVGPGRQKLSQLCARTQLRASMWNLQ